jgi:deoxyribodipyrimidine photo-lyase
LELFPAAIDLEALDLQQARMLRTWFVAHVEIKPHRTPAQRKPSTRSRKKKQSDGFIQLSLLNEA